MGTRSEALAAQFAAKVQDVAAVIETLSDAECKKTAASEKWPVGVVAHHIAIGYEGLAGIIKTVAAGQSMPNFTLDMLNARNAKHAQEFANCAKAETLALCRKNAAAAAAIVRGLSDADLARSGTVLAGMPPMSVEQIVTRFLIGHIDEHFGSIRATVGR